MVPIRISCLIRYRLSIGGTAPLALHRGRVPGSRTVFFPRSSTRQLILLVALIGGMLGVLACDSPSAVSRAKPEDRAVVEGCFVRPSAQVGGSTCGMTLRCGCQAG